MRGRRPLVFSAFLLLTACSPLTPPGVNTAGYAVDRENCGVEKPLPQKYTLVPEASVPSPGSLVWPSDPGPVVVVRYAACKQGTAYVSHANVAGVYLVSPRPDNTPAVTTPTTPAAATVQGKTYYLTYVSPQFWDNPLKQLSTGK